MVNNPNGFQREIKIKGQRLEAAENFKYLGATISNEGSKPVIYIYPGERGGSVVECRTPEREVRGSRPTAAVLCP